MIDTTCPTCSDRGHIADAPEGERIYCECVTGLRAHIKDVTRRMEDVGNVLRLLGQNMTELTAIFDELSVKLDEIEQNEVGRCRGRLFEGEVDAC